MVDFLSSFIFQENAATDTMQLSQIFATTTIAPAVATVSAMLYTWIRNGKPDVSMSLNGSLAGLVAVTAGCANVDAIGSFIIGAVAGVLVCVAVYFIEDMNSANGTKAGGTLLDYKMKVSLQANEILEFADEKFRFI